jgi:glycosyltransferase involved in cell wall biosynthesis
VRDTIVFSTWSWDQFNVPERIALALAMRGARVLYCEMPVSRFRRRAVAAREIRERVYAFGPEYLGEKFGFLGPVRTWQWKRIAHDILDQARRLGLQDPLFLYSHVRHIAPLCDAMRTAGLPLVHTCMDYPEPYQYDLIEISDLTVVIPKTVFEVLRSKYGRKIAWIPQSIHLPETGAPDGQNATAAEPQELRAVPRPHLGYLGPLQGRVDLQLMREVLKARRNWHFICFGGSQSLLLPNVHRLSWLTPDKMPSCVAAFDVGVMPYDISDAKNLHCVPLKLFDYFAEGIPVVSTSVLSLAEFADAVYFGNTSEEFIGAVEEALVEPLTSAKREARKRIAQEHSTEALGWRLEEVLSDIDPKSIALNK